MVTTKVTSQMKTKQLILIKRQLRLQRQKKMRARKLVRVQAQKDPLPPVLLLRLKRRKRNQRRYVIIIIFFIIIIYLSNRRKKTERTPSTRIERRLLKNNFHKLKTNSLKVILIFTNTESPLLLPECH